MTDISFQDAMGVHHHTAEGAARADVIRVAKIGIIHVVTECGLDGLHADRRIGAAENAAAMLTLYRQRIHLNAAFDLIDHALDRYLATGGELRTLPGFANWSPKEPQ